MVRKLGLILVSLIAVMLAACGGGAAGGGGGTVALDQTYNADGVTFKYPSGWVTQGSGASGPIFAANNQDTLTAAQSGDTTSLKAGQQIITILTLPSAVNTTGAMTEIDLLKQMTTGMTGAAGAPVLGEPTAATIGGKPAARATGTGDSGDGTAIIINQGDAGYVIIFGIAAKGEMSNLDGILNGVADSLTVTAPTG